MSSKLHYALIIIIGLSLFSIYAHTTRVYDPGQEASEIDKIKVFVDSNEEMKNQKGENMVIITVINNSSKTFTGKLKLSSIGVNNEYLTFDLVHLNIFPGKAESKVVWLKESLVPHIKTEIIEPHFSSFEPKIN